MNHEWEHWCVLYTPLILSLVLLSSLHIYPRLKTAIILCTFWQLASLPWLDKLAQHFGFWSFQPATVFVSTPLSFYLGWALFWGIVGTLILGKWPSVNARWWTLALLIGLDIALMPFFTLTVNLSPLWLLGELLVVMLGLVPGLWLAHWTLSRQNPCRRAFILCIAFGSASMTLTPFMAGYSLPEITARLLQLSLWQHMFYLGSFIILSAPAVAAVKSFATLGRATPIPFDPPSHLVTASVYSYIANPMQSSIVLCLFLWGFYLDLPLFWGLAIIAICYCIGLGAWSEKADLKKRFGAPWLQYRNLVKNWKCKLIPTITPSQQATLFIDYHCAPCCRIARWFSSKKPLGLVIEDAANYPGPPLKAITYRYHDGTTCHSVAAIAAALQHLHLGWAWAAWLISYPGIEHAIQLSMDATGATARPLNNTPPP